MKIDATSLGETTEAGSELRSAYEQALPRACDEDADLHASEGLSGLQTPDPLDFLPWDPVPAAFLECQIAEAMARLEKSGHEQVFFNFALSYPPPYPWNLCLQISIAVLLAKS